MAAYIIDARQAAQFGDYDTLKDMLDKGFISPDCTDSDDCSLLHWAAINNRLKIAKLLIDYNCNVNAIGGVLCSTPLHWAARHGHTKMVALLMKYDANPYLRNVEGFAAIHVAAQFGCTPVVAYLISKGVSPDEKDASSMTPAMWAAYKVHSLDLLKMLVTLKADVNIADVSYGNTCLHWAVIQENTSAVELLVSLDIDINKDNKQRETPLIIAKRKGIFVRWLLKIIDNTKHFLYLPFGVTVGLKILMIFSWIFYIHGIVPWYINMSFYLLLLFITYIYVNLTFTDPGIYSVSIQETYNMISKTFEEENFSDKFCTTCLLIRPHRSKHCKFCDKCILRFDHHCPWIGNCVGANNHFHFLIYLLSLIIELLIIIYGCVTNFLHMKKIYITISDTIINNTWILYVFILSNFILIWICIMTYLQLYQIANKLTTNERINAYKYSYIGQKGSQERVKFLLSKNGCKNLKLFCKGEAI
ncbi:Zinc finger, DHHC-type, palmitoyltransferase domain and Ankyrin repeat and Ankyrin repeat-containing domain-containing protein [Strongyloides ratti]|uniref:Palmitoyltransferase n=1 Tax=Strongyloides ratti TaxID=34506 RepID=A0A090KYW2_STRRB|nr:Zinc finger, DHHC-type, palmitoyltransferase domain and Ankyrin repeat and Ankyrin repeat-containing domain-containing protein [Strongyloides ratti]CEF60429.1 Zinc finger, DHHC-type, palmitoyltransferase domain and Ankyrin repeat and Ankyrin repeat-containing domain-containing protein [Strongyloides ratti]